MMKLMVHRAFCLFFIAVSSIMVGCKKEQAVNGNGEKDKHPAVTDGYTVHASIRKLDEFVAGSANYELSFWVTTNTDDSKVLQLPGALLLTGNLSAGNEVVEKSITLQPGTYVTRQIYQFKAPVSVMGKFSVPSSYQGKPIKCDDTILEKPYSLTPIKVNGTGFADANGKKFIPWGVNYTNTHQLPLMDMDWYNTTNWEIIKGDFLEMKAMGLNVIRIHLQYNRFMTDLNTPNQQALNRLSELADYTASIGLYLDVTGLASYLKEEDPAWYINTTEAERWATQAKFWGAIAKTLKSKNNIFCYNLINEPVTPPKDTDIWLPGDSFGGYYFVNHLTRTPSGRSWETVTRQWIQQLKTAIRTEDTRTPVTVGFIGLGKVTQLNDLLDYTSIHIYPESDKMQQAYNIVSANVSAKPLIIEETSWGGGFPQMTEFINTTQNSGQTAGYFAHYHGETIAELEKKTDIGSAIQREWYRLYCFKLNPNVRIP